MASTANVAQKILADELIPSSIKDFIHSQKYVTNLHVTYLVDKEQVKDLLAYYYPCGKWETPIAAIVLHKMKAADSINAPDDKELISVYLLDHTAKDLLNTPEKELYEKVWEMALKFEPSLPEKYEPVACFPRDNAIPLHEVGRYKKMANKIKDTQSGNLVLLVIIYHLQQLKVQLRSGKMGCL